MNHYQWRVGYNAKCDAEKCYAELMVIRKRDGNVTPKAILDKAKSKRSAMHRQFEWDDSIAAEKHRLRQASDLGRAIEVIRTEMPKAPMGVFSNVSVAGLDKMNKPKKAMITTEEAMRDPVYRDELLGNAIRDAITYRRKYALLQELSQVLTAMDDFIEHKVV